VEDFTMSCSSEAAVADMRYGPSADRGLILDLAGPFRLRDTQGTDLTPRSRKAQGLLALVATSPGLRRSRAWLQDKLWSDRAPEQGASSLRHCLTEIRSMLGEHLACLTTVSGWIGLGPDRVLVNTSLLGRENGEAVEFLEGLDIRDPEFEHWLRDQRTFHAQRADRSLGVEVKRPVVRKSLPGAFGEGARAAELIRAYEDDIAALERLVGRQALELELLKAALRDEPCLA
jgi:hypothetical protein